MENRKHLYRKYRDGEKDITNGRIKDSELPKGLYKYDLREDENGIIATIEKSVYVNHGGTILVKNPIDFEEKEYYEFNDDTLTLNFLGYCLTLNEFISTDLT